MNCKRAIMLVALPLSAVTFLAQFAAAETTVPTSVRQPLVMAQNYQGNQNQPVTQQELDQRAAARQQRAQRAARQREAQLAAARQQEAQRAARQQEAQRAAARQREAQLAARQQEAQRAAARQQEAQRAASRRVWVDGHWDNGFLGIGRKWVPGHWEQR